MVIAAICSEYDIMGAQDAHDVIKQVEADNDRPITEDEVRHLLDTETHALRIAGGECKDVHRGSIKYFRWYIMAKFNKEPQL